MKKHKFEVLSPDGFTIERESEYNSLKEAKTALNEFIKRYEKQGYYSKSNREQLPVNEIAKNCIINKL